MARTERHGSAGALVLLDLDGFKEVNDRLGHPSGDDVLRAVADGLRARLRAGDVAARIGGDEFAVLLTGVTIEEAVSVAEEFRDAVKAAASRPAERQLSGSVGVVLLEPGTSARQLLIEGDRALYEAKGAGRDRVVSVPARPDPRPRPEG
jgi:diguanylate cyclase (GGDEF)-like protein